MNQSPVEGDLREAGAFRSSSATHPGSRRENQDSCLNRPDLGIWAVADGAGGHRGGAEAARAVVAALDAIPSGLTGGELLAQVRLRLAGVHAALRGEAAKFGDDALMATTVVVLIVRSGHFACLWAGDSRAYRMQGGSPEQLTRDHSLVRQLIEDGEIAPEEASAHPQANVITRAIGADEEQPGLEKVTGETVPDDVFLLCTDGVWKALDADDLAGLLTVPIPTSAQIVEAALARDPSDNLTAVVVEVAEGDGSAG